MQNKTLTFFILAADGIVNHSAGVGTTVSGWLNCLPDIEKELKNFNISIKLYLIAPYLKDGYEYKNDLIIEKNKAIVKKYNGELIQIDNGTEGLSGFGINDHFSENWEIASKNGAIEIAKHIIDEDFNVIICVDTPFLKTATFLQDYI